VVDLQFLRLLQQAQIGTSNPKTTLEHFPEKWAAVFRRNAVN
jgi:hypothetical protein